MERCETCRREVEEVVVYALPGVPMSVGNCRICAALGVYPYFVCVGNTVAIGGWDNAAPWWQDAVIRSLAMVDKTWFDFIIDVERVSHEVEDKDQ